MIPELGHFALIIALGLACILAFFPLLGASMGISTWVAMARPLARGQFAFIAIAFMCLMHGFITCDFSVAYIAQNSNSALPLGYRISAVWGGPALREGKLAIALPAERRLQQVAVSTIGAFAAALVERREAVFGKRYNIAGDELTGTEAAAVLSRVTRREIRFEGFPPDVLRADSEDMALMFEWFDRVGYSANIEDLRHEFPDLPWLSFENWASKQDWSTLS